MKFIKLVSKLLTLVVLLIIGAVAYVSYTFDEQEVKAKMTEVVKQQTGRVLTIDGDLELAFWPSVGFDVSKVALSESDGVSQFASLDEAHVTVDVMPLWSSQVVAKQINISGLKATLIKNKNGELNIADLMAGKPEQQPEAAPGEAKAFTVAVAGVSLSNAALTWRDEQAGSNLSLVDLDLSTDDLALDSKSKGLSINALKIGTRGTLNEDQFELSLDAPHINLSPTLTDSESITLTARVTGPARNLELNLVLGGLALKGDQLSVQALNLDADAKAENAVVKAQLSAPLTFDLAKQVLALSKFSGNLELDHPQLPMKHLSLPLAGNLHADLGASKAALTLDTKLDDSVIGLALNVPKFAGPELVFHLNIDQLDVDRYLPQQTAAQEGGGEAAAGSDKVDLSALNQLGDMKVQGNIKIGKLTASKVKMQDVSLVLQAAKGRLEIAPHSMKLYQGSINGVISLKAEGNRVTIKEQLEGIQIQPLLQDLADKDLISGQGNVNLNLSTGGPTVTAMKKSLNGTAELVLNDGAINGIDIAGKIRQAKALFKSGQQADAAAGGAGEKTDFSELSASFNIKDGVAHNNDLQAKSPLLRLAGAGTVDIGQSVLDYLAKASIVATSTGQGGKDLGDVKGLTVPVRLTGPLTQPEWKLEFGDMFTEAAKQQVMEKVDEIKDTAKAQVQEKIAEQKTAIQDKAAGEIKDKLKGLFGR